MLVFLILFLNCVKVICDGDPNAVKELIWTLKEYVENPPEPEDDSILSDEERLSSDESTYEKSPSLLTMFKDDEFVGDEDHQYDEEEEERVIEGSSNFMPCHVFLMLT